MTSPTYHPPVKRSVRLSGHMTSVSLEPVFWAALEAQAQRRNQSINALVGMVDRARLTAERPPNLTSALRQWLWDQVWDRGAGGGLGGGSDQTVDDGVD